MGSVKLKLEDAKLTLECRVVRGRERMGAPNRFEIEAFSPEPIEPDQVLGKAGGLLFDTAYSDRLLVGIISSFTGIATSQREKGRRYRATLESGLCSGRLRRDSVVYQDLTAKEIIQQALAACHWSSDNLNFDLIQSTLAKRRYVVQYDETCENFVHRICLREGLGYFSSEQAGTEVLNFFSDSTAFKPKSPSISVVTDSKQQTHGLFAWTVERRRRRRPGKVRLRDYDPWGANPEMEAILSEGTDLEQSTEVYRAPGGFKTEKEGADQARLTLERLRGDSDSICFFSNAAMLSPGVCFKLEATKEFREGRECAGTYVVHSVQHRHRHGDDRLIFQVTAIPVKLPWRRTGNVMVPRIHGLQSAIVTGGSGEEIHPDQNGSVFIRYFWDRTGPTDHNSSLPVRVMQPNTPGSMAIPRVGWEVFVAHENGDPDRPIVVGRAYNANQMPPFDLPANKTMTALRSLSSPGAGTMNSIHFDDAAGRQHVHIFAGFGKATTVANNMKTQTVKVEEKSIHGSQTMTIGVNQSVSVGQLYAIEAASQTMTVGASQSKFVQGELTISTSSETVMVGGALLEKVGNPVTGLKNLGTSVAMAVAGAYLGKAGTALGGKIGGALGGSLKATGIGKFVGGKVVSMGLSAGLAGYKASSASGGNVGAAVATSLAGGLIGMIPGGSALASTFTSLGGKYPWEPPAPPAGTTASGGGSGGAKSDNTGAKGPGPGHRKEKVEGAWLEMIGGALAINTPGTIKWETVGASAFVIGGSHVIKAKTYSQDVLGAYIQTLGSMKVHSTTDVTEALKGAIKQKIAGQLTIKTNGEFTLHSDATVTLKAASLKLKGSHVTFKVGSSVVSLSPGGVEVKASTIEIKGATKQSGGTGHG